ncbi:23S rRNA (cytidine(2498)-2'-O)-methyltransferase RlmM [Larsenimonas rhizosphaerae]|uniref:Ribosomal RNA large subunit methyltransferase M n=1 Tax=Larsenimonas rhizosphaerae TaxID=2944682 RepID=A0AA41ZEM9_9GAMM|nr:23S rRNA (cytidine(2498)-2'-O)-methyltransferase RlmM [Larsenimonas rhizosphaerae]MCX2523892.1 23S rRNA (cytidine(2498)-2'-O)-methyltransferase RlmM [Larsenimonas rhizosphaerae]
MASIPNELLFYCRPGFERDLARELTDKTYHLDNHIQTVNDPNTGFTRLVLPEGQPANTVHKQLPLTHLVFARQILVAFSPLQLNRNDRITALVSLIQESGWNFEELWQEWPDTNDGKGLTGLCKSLQRPLEGILKKRGALRRKAGKRRLHLFWTSGDCVQVAMSFPQNRSEWPNGIKHLRFPHAAPSRSTLKLEEAWHAFIERDAWDQHLHAGMQAADLGAAPGGWTWQLVQRGMFVYAIDNGPMNADLVRTGLVEHLKEDGFVWSPPDRLDWLVCDIVDQPVRVTRMIERWLVNQWCWYSIFNLKLPMKKRWEEVSACIEQLETTLSDAGITFDIACKHLYHDREEVTVYVRLY